jgi:hypothetical protein
VLGQPKAVVAKAFCQLPAGQQLTVGLVDGFLAVPAVKRRSAGEPGVWHLDAAEHEDPDAHSAPPSDDAADDVDVINIVGGKCHGRVSLLFPRR